MNASPTLALLVGALALCVPACHPHHEAHAEGEHHKIVVTTPKLQEVVVTQPYVCLIHSQRHIKVCALQSGFLEPIQIKEGQVVKKGDVLFRLLPTLYQARLDAEQAEATRVRVEYENTQRLAEPGKQGEKPVVSQMEVVLKKAELDKANAKAKLAAAELGFTTVTAPFDGIVDRLHEQQGSLIKEGEVLTTLSDNSTMWVYFNVPEVRYLDYKLRQGTSLSPSQLKLLDSRIELQLADGSKFDQAGGDTVTVEGKFNNETGNIAFRADFPNPRGLLRHGQTGNVLIHRTVPDALVIPQRATFEILDKRYVYVVDKDNEIHQREIVVEHELDDIFVIKKELVYKDEEPAAHGGPKPAEHGAGPHAATEHKPTEHKAGEHKAGEHGRGKVLVKGLEVTDRIIVEGGRPGLVGHHATDTEFRKPEDVLASQKQKAE